jgi:hypothetical protein
MSAAFATSATSPVDLRLRKDYGIARTAVLPVDLRPRQCHDLLDEQRPRQCEALDDRKLRAGCLVEAHLLALKAELLLEDHLI